MNNYKKYFPIFKKNPSLVYLDSAATTLKPQTILDKMMEYYTEYSANIHRGLYPISDRATEEYEKTRKFVADFIGAEYENEIIFTSGTTAGINIVARGWGEANLSSGDEIVITEMEHHSNLVPWQELAKRKNLILKFLEVSSSTYQVSSIEQQLTSRTKLLAITQVSNVLGTVNPIKEIVRKVREINPDIVILVDGAQAVAHLLVNVKELEVDFYAFSGHKMYGPTGVGVLYAKAKRQLEMKPDNFGGGMIREVNEEDSIWIEGPEKFEAGTPPIGEVIGLGAAVEFLKMIDTGNIYKHEKELTEYLLDKLSRKPNIRIIGPEKDRIGVVSIVFDEEDYGSAHDWSAILADKGNICTRSGHHCAMPLHNILGLPNGTLRISLGIYNDKEDIDKLISGVESIKKIFS